MPDTAAAAQPTAAPTSLRRGVRDALSVVVAYVPFGLALGAALASAGVDPLTAWASSWLIFAGAAQLVAVELLGAGAGVLVVVATALVVNARHLLYSASIAPYARTWPARWRWILAYALADPVYALAITRYEADGTGGTARDRRRYLLGVSVVCWSAWQLLVGAGVLLSGLLPAALPLEIAAPLTFLLLLLPSLRGAATYAAAAAGGLVALATMGLPFGLNLMAGAGAGVAAGMWVGRHA
jgi:4-azaleucine resistance transporter AzlC